MSEKIELTQEQLGFAEEIRPKEVDDAFVVYWDNIINVITHIDEAILTTKKIMAIIDKNKYPNSGFNVKHLLKAIERHLKNCQNQLKESE